ncbi:amidase signature domain-containing protein [Xylariales sp. PMI_506]|nr:amidase signature domain-containing protein [Xylariales sp. PMI_506]
MVRVGAVKYFYAVIATAGSLATAQLASTGLSVTYNEIDYFISPYESGTLSVSSSALDGLAGVYGFAPVTIVSESVAQGDLSALAANWTAIDDVFQPAFLQAAFLSGVKGSSCSSSANITVAGVTAHVFSLGNSSIPSGPYFLEKSSGKVYPVYRLYDDFAGAFTEALLMKPDGSFQALSAQVSTSATLTVGVPSRLYYTPTAEKPLAGVRIGVKDIYQLEGIKASYGNRAWYHLYPASNVTGTAISRLIAAGAVIVGTQKPSQFANGETATADWVDYHSPFNPRADGYQDPSSSSSGGGASVASYPWLDVAVGSDTGGSIRGPAGVQGIYGNRPSMDLVSLDNVMPLAPSSDTGGFLLRDPALWDRVNSVMYAGNYTSLADVAAPAYPTQIYTVGFPNASTTSGAILADFASALADFVGGTVSAVTLQGLWDQNPPSDAPANTSLSSMLNLVYPLMISKEQIPLVREPFYADYAAVHDGRLPFVDPVPLARWAFGDSYPASALDEALANKTIFADWFNSEVLAPVEDPAQCSSSLLLYPSSSGQNPRNAYLDPPSAPAGFSSGRISVFAGCPDSVYPLGVFADFSDITNHTEYYPVGVDILAAKGCDGLLARLAVDLMAQGVLNVSLTGSTMYGGDILL